MTFSQLVPLEEPSMKTLFAAHTPPDSTVRRPPPVFPLPLLPTRTTPAFVIVPPSWTVTPIKKVFPCDLSQISRPSVSAWTPFVTTIGLPLPLTSFLLEYRNT